MVVWDGRVGVLGGQQPFGDYESEQRLDGALLDPSTGEWSPLPDLPAGDPMMAPGFVTATVADGRLFVVARVTADAYVLAPGARSGAASGRPRSTAFSTRSVSPPGVGCSPPTGGNVRPRPPRHLDLTSGQWTGTADPPVARLDTSVLAPTTGCSRWPAKWHTTPARQRRCRGIRPPTRGPSCLHHRWPIDWTPPSPGQATSFSCGVGRAKAASADQATPMAPSSTRDRQIGRSCPYSGPSRTPLEVSPGRATADAEPASDELPARVVPPLVSTTSQRATAARRARLAGCRSRQTSIPIVTGRGSAPNGQSVRRASQHVAVRCRAHTARSGALTPTRLATQAPPRSAVPLAESGPGARPVGPVRRAASDSTERSNV